MADLATRVYEVGATEHAGVEAARECVRFAHEDELTDYESELCDWSVLFGLAYGIARGEDPYESAESVSERATEATRVAWQRWTAVSRPVRGESTAEVR